MVVAFAANTIVSNDEAIASTVQYCSARFELARNRWGYNLMIFDLLPRNVKDIMGAYITWTYRWIKWFYLFLDIIVIIRNLSE